VTVTSLDLQVAAGTGFNYTLTASGGTPPYRWSIASGNLPPGLTLDGSNGIISGTPTTTGSYTFTLVATDSANVSGQKAITIRVAAAALPAFTIGAPDTAAAAQQPVVTISLASAYTADVTGTLTLTFQSSVGGDDQSIRFSTGSRTVNFVIPAGSTQASFTGSPGPLNVLTGTVAGTITLSANYLAAGVPGNASKQIAIGTGAPVITSVTFQATGIGLNVVVTGYSTTREMVSGLFHFAPTSGATLAQSDLTVQLTSAFATWYGNAQSNATGSQFTLTQPFTVQGSVSSISAVSVSLTNTKGTSPVVNPQ
jgi:hypothetical protein